MTHLTDKVWAIPMPQGAEVGFAEWKDKHAFWGKRNSKWIVFPNENDSETCVQVDSNEGIYQLWQQSKSKV